MKNKRESFVFYRSFYDAIISCPTAARNDLFAAICRYALDNVPPTFESSEYGGFLNAVWVVVRPQLDANYKRYENGCKGGAPRGNQNARKPTEGQGMKTTKNNRKQPNDNDNVNANVNVNVKGGLILPYESVEFTTTWDELRQQPKWRKKSETALRKSLEQLGKYPEPFALVLMNNAIANDWQGVVFTDTQKAYEEWQRSNPPTKGSSSTTTPVTSVKQIMSSYNAKK